MNQCTFLYLREKTTIIRPKILGATIYNLVAPVTKHPGFVHPCGGHTAYTGLVNRCVVNM
jgi:hypothetical protein